ncbi:hypothetical protein NB689_002938 [Xanthomonas sacchari]|nr:hypothetical protein [Xanthomonas sacchari]
MRRSWRPRTCRSSLRLTRRATTIARFGGDTLNTSPSCRWLMPGLASTSTSSEYSTGFSSKARTQSWNSRRTCSSVRVMR